MGPAHRLEAGPMHRFERQILYRSQVTTTYCAASNTDCRSACN